MPSLLDLTPHIIMEQIQYFPIERIKAQTQVRREFPTESLAELAASLKEVGQLQPIRVRKVGEEFLIVDGERRYRAAQLAGMATLAVIVEEKDLSNGEVIQRQLIANCQREDLSPIEKARAMSQLMDSTGWKLGVMATRLGISAGSATKLMGLLKLPAAIQRQVTSGKIGLSAAYELTRVEDTETQQGLAEQLATGQLTRDALAGRLKSQQKPVGRSTNGSTGRVTAQLGAGRTVTVAGPALNLEGFIELLEELLGKARKIRPQGVELGTFIKMLKDQAQ